MDLEEGRQQLPSFRVFNQELIFITYRMKNIYVWIVVTIYVKWGVSSKDERYNDKAGPGLSRNDDCL